MPETKKQQTAMEWMVEQFNSHQFRYGDRTQIIEQALKMEAEQLTAANLKGQQDMMKE